MPPLFPCYPYFNSLILEKVNYSWEGNVRFIRADGYQLRLSLTMVYINFGDTIVDYGDLLIVLKVIEPLSVVLQISPIWFTHTDGF